MVKILVAGGVQGRLGWLFNRVHALNSSKHGPFDAVLCTGEFFGPVNAPGAGDECVASTNAASASDSAATDVPSKACVDVQNYLDGGDKEFPVPLYFVSGMNSHPCLASALNSQTENCIKTSPSNKQGPFQVGHNLHWLGPCGILTVAGLRIAFLSGTTKGPNESAGFSQYLPRDVKVLVESASELGLVGKVDVVITPEWPQDLASSQESAPDGGASLDAKAINQALCPRYHFSGGSHLFWQRAPFASSKAGVYTRFIGLSDIRADSTDKSRKWLHALSLQPCSSQAYDPNAPAPPGCTPNPFVSKSDRGEKMGGTPRFSADSGHHNVSVMTAADVARITAEEESKATQHFWKVNNSSNRGRKRCHPGGNGQQPRRKRRFNVVPRGDCWYCLASDACEAHLIVSVYDDVFASLPKGALSAQHCQIIPVSHEPSLASLEPEVLSQVIRFKQALVDYYESFGCVALFFERNIVLEKALQRHAFLEAIPLPKTCVQQCMAVLTAQAERCGGIAFTPLETVESGSIPGLDTETEKDGLASLKALLGGGIDTDHETETDAAVAAGEYMYIEVSGGGIAPRVCRINPDLDKVAHKRLPLYFGRTLACVMLNVLDRINWKGCIVPEHVEKRMTEDFKQGWAKFDFTTTS